MAKTPSKQYVATSHVPNRRAENIVVMAIIVPELELRNIEREIFAADLVIATDDAALEDAPETFNRVGVHRTDYGV